MNSDRTRIILSLLMVVLIGFAGPRRDNAQEHDRALQAILAKALSDTGGNAVPASWQSPQVVAEETSGSVGPKSNQSENQAHAPGEIIIKFNKTLDRKQIEELIEPLDIEIASHLSTLDLYLLKLPKDVEVVELSREIAMNPLVDFAGTNAI